MFFRSKEKCGMCAESIKNKDDCAKIVYTLVNGDDEEEVIKYICNDCEKILEKLNGIYEERQDESVDSVRLREINSNDEDPLDSRSRPTRRN